MSGSVTRTSQWRAGHPVRPENHGPRASQRLCCAGECAARWTWIAALAGLCSTLVACGGSAIRPESDRGAGGAAPAVEPATFEEVPGDLEALERQIECAGYAAPLVGRAEHPQSLDSEAVEEARRLLGSRLTWIDTDDGPVGSRPELDALTAGARVVEVSSLPDGTRRAVVAVGLLQVRAVLERAGRSTRGIAQRFDRSRFAVEPSSLLDPATVERALGPTPAARPAPTGETDMASESPTIDLATPWRATVPSGVSSVAIAGTVRAPHGLTVMRAGRAGSQTPAALELGEVAPRAATFALEVPLAPGPNEIHLVVRDTRGVVAGWRVTIERAR